MKGKILLAWSGGKDSALALYELLKSNLYEVVSLLVTITSDYDRVSMHGVRRELIERQALALGFPLDIVLIPKNCTNEEYEKRMEEKMICYKNKGVEKVAFGDIFLEDVREYRERNLARAGMEGVFPIWGRTSRELAESFIEMGFKAVTTCVDGKALTKDFVGREFNREFIASLPPESDPSGENGEFHTFVYDGPIFKEKVAFKRGEIVLREGRFYFCDLLLLEKEVKR